MYIYTLFILKNHFILILQAHNRKVDFFMCLTLLVPCIYVFPFQYLEGPAPLYELPADRDGGDGLLPGEVS